MTLPDIQLSGGPVTRLEYYDLFLAAETAHWEMRDIPWGDIDDSVVDGHLLDVVERAALGEMTTYEATQRFMTAFEDDVDFTQWISVWFFEETKHPQALMRWLQHFGRSLSEAQILEARTTLPFVDSRAGTLAINVLAETVAAANYLRLATLSPEPVLATIATNLARDEARHASGFYRYAQRELARTADPVKAKKTVLMILYMWFKQRTRMGHPGMIIMREMAEATTGDDRRDWLEDTGQGVLERICLQFSLLLDEPSLRQPGDVKTILQGLRATR